MILMLIFIQFLIKSFRDLIIKIEILLIIPFISQSLLILSVFVKNFSPPQIFEAIFPEHLIYSDVKDTFVN